MNRLLNLLKGMMFFQLHDSMEGGTGAPPPAPPPNLFEGIDTSNFHSDLLGDEAFAAQMKEILGEEKPAEEKPAEEKPAEEKPAEEKPAEEKPAEEKPAEEKPAEEKPAEEDFELEFENDLVIDDVTFSKDVLKALPVEVVESIGKLKTKLDDAGNGAAAVEDFKKELLKDPVIADRIERQKTGKSTPYARVGVTQETFNAVTAVLKENGLDDDVAGAVFKAVHKELLADIEANTQAAVNNALMQQQAVIETERINTQGKEYINEIAKMHKNLTPEAVREWCMDPARKGSGKDGNLTYSDLLRMKDALGTEAVYAAIAKSKGLPVVINSAERDKEMLKNERSKYFDAIGAKRVAKAMRPGSAPDTSGNKGGTIDHEGGVIDLSKLDDYDYIDSLMVGKNEKEIAEIQKMLKKHSA